MSLLGSEVTYQPMKKLVKVAKSPYADNSDGSKQYNAPSEVKLALSQLDTDMQHLRSLEQQVREAKQALTESKRQLVRALVDNDMYDCLTVNQAAVRKYSEY